MFCVLIFSAALDVIVTEGAWPSQSFIVAEGSYDAAFDRIASGATVKHEYSVQAIEGPHYVRTEPATVFYKPDYGSQETQVSHASLCLLTVSLWQNACQMICCVQRTKSSVLQLLVLTNTMRIQRALLRAVSPLPPSFVSGAAGHYPSIIIQTYGQLLRHATVCNCVLQVCSGRSMLFYVNGADYEHEIAFSDLRVGHLYKFCESNLIVWMAASWSDIACSATMSAPSS